MATIHRTTMSPTKIDLLTPWITGQPWYDGGPPRLEKAGGFRLDDPQGEVGVEFMFLRDAAGRRTYHVPLTYRGAPYDGLAEHLVGTAEHGVLGPRWIYDGVHDPVLLAQLVALIAGAVLPQAQSQSDTVDPTVTVRSALTDALPNVATRTANDATGTTAHLAGNMSLRVVRVLGGITASPELLAVVEADWACGADAGRSAVVAVARG